MNREKQEEVRGFLAWLEREIGAPLDALTGHTRLRNYLGNYQKGEPPLTLEELLEVLRRSRAAAEGRPRRAGLPGAAGEGVRGQPGEAPAPEAPSGRHRPADRPHRLPPLRADGGGSTGGGGVAPVIPVETLCFPNGRTARLVRVSPQTPPDTLLAALDPGAPRALVVLCGGAGGMSREEIEAVRPLLVDGLARLAAQERIAILDGGTNSGVMALVGEGARATT